MTSNAQLVVWSTTNFVDDVVGSYGAVNDFQGGDNVSSSIVSPGEGGGSSQAWEISFEPPNAPNINFQTGGNPYPTFGNTNTFLANYTLSFDMQVTGNDVSPGSGLQISIFANKLGPSAFYVFGGNLLLPTTATTVFTNGVGYQHYSIPLGSFKDNSFSANNFNMSEATNLCVGIGYVSYPTDLPVAVETIDIANLQITMATNPPPPPRPSIAIAPANPGLRIFLKASDAVYTQEGIGTVDSSSLSPNQSWVGSATTDHPVSYSINFLDFDTVANFTMNVQFAPGAASGNPYGVYGNANDLLWTITSGGGVNGFRTAVAFKTNSPNNSMGGETNVLLATMTTTSTNGRGTWTLTFTSDTNATVTAPDGSTGSFVMAPDAAAQFANPLTILFGISAGATGGFGQYVDIGRITVTNVVGINEDDIFTQDDELNTNLWNPNFSRDNPGYGNDAGSVLLVSSNTPSYWVHWNIPDASFGLETKASVTGPASAWFSPDYYGTATGVTNSIPSVMGSVQRWTLVPKGCLPTLNGTPGGPASPTVFFRLASPAPAQ